MDDKNKKRRNRSLVEFIANRETIETLLRQGYNMQWIFDDLHEKGSITVSYWAFRRTLLKMRPKDQDKPRVAPVAGAKPPPSAPAPARTGGPQILGSTAQSMYDQLKEFAKEDPIGRDDKS